MPYVRIAVAADLTPSQVAQLQRGTTELMARLLGKRADLTVVSVARDDAVCWSVGGNPATRTMAQIQAFITEGTNTAEEKEAFIAAAHTLLTEVVGESDGPLYVIVSEVSAGNWGYDGLSQQARRNLWTGRAAA
ncbi:MAG TPA: tautomerase family protein [Rhodocyclaceae bacterium]|nr:tautomerase family protein [Rhodocyclaceae bacterium]